MAVPITNMKISDITSALSITNTNVSVTDLFFSPNIIGSGLDSTYCSGADGYERLANLMDLANIGGTRELRIGKFRNYNPVSIFYKQGHLYTYDAFHNYNYINQCVNVPIGWHIATVTDISNIITAIEFGNTFSSNTVAKYLKSAYLSDDTPFDPSPAWNGTNPNYDTYGFKMMASGFCLIGENEGDEYTLINVGLSSRFWMKYSDAFNYAAQFTDNSDQIVSNPLVSDYDLCQIRLVKDDSVNTGSVIDIEGNVYKTIKIGDIVITAEGIRTTKNKLGNPLTNIPIGSDVRVDYGYVSITNTDIP